MQNAIIMIDNEKDEFSDFLNLTFAKVYDIFMDETPYEAWCAYLKQKLCEAGITDGLLLELGCGTGALTQLLEDAGFDMIGVDNSIEMLEEANRKKILENREILYLLQDMREFELYGTVRAVICACDSINYLTDKEDLIHVHNEILRSHKRERICSNMDEPKSCRTK